MCGFDERWRVGIIVKSVAQLTNGDFENGFADKGFRPDGVEKFLFSDELTWMHYEVVEHRESFRSELNCLRPSPQALIRKVQTKGVKGYEFLIAHVVHR